MCGAWLPSSMITLIMRTKNMQHQIAFIASLSIFTQIRLIVNAAPRFLDMNIHLCFVIDITTLSIFEIVFPSRGSWNILQSKQKCCLKFCVFPSRSVTIAIFLIMVTEIEKGRKLWLQNLSMLVLSVIFFFGIFPWFWVYFLFWCRIKESQNTIRCGW